MFPFPVYALRYRVLETYLGEPSDLPVKTGGAVARCAPNQPKKAKQKLENTKKWNRTDFLGM